MVPARCILCYGAGLPSIEETLGGCFAAIFQDPYVAFRLPVLGIAVGRGIKWPVRLFPACLAVIGNRQFIFLSQKRRTVFLGYGQPGLPCAIQRQDAAPLFIFCKNSLALYGSNRAIAL